jgi:hypothetical protein
MFDRQCEFATVNLLSKLEVITERSDGAKTNYQDVMHLSCSGPGFRILLVIQRWYNINY